MRPDRDTQGLPNSRQSTSDWTVGTQGFHAALYVDRHVRTCTRHFKASNAGGWPRLAEARDPYLTRGLVTHARQETQDHGFARTQGSDSKRNLRTHFLSLFMLLLFLSILTSHMKASACASARTAAACTPRALAGSFVHYSTENFSLHRFHSFQVLFQKEKGEGG